MFMKFNGKKSMALIIVMALVLSFMTGCTDNGSVHTNTTEIGGNSNADSSGAEFDVLSNDAAEKAEEIESYIDNYFYFDEDAESREESYYDGIMAGLDDPYSVYYTPEEYQELLEEDEGEYVGIGATVSKDMETNEVYIVKPIIGSPAEAAGLKPQDVFVEIDGVEITADMELEEVVDMIRGEEGTTAHIKIYREGETDYLDFEIVRQQVENVTVAYEMLENNIGYIQVDQFIMNTPEQFKAALDDLESQGMTSLIVDMRNNPGGLLTAVTEMCDYIIEDGVIVYTEDKYGNVINTWETEDDESLDIPMVVLVNGDSASASEIFTGCMKDYGKATIVGTTTYGKGIVQSLFPLSDGSAIKLTIAKYFTPNGSDIHEKGIEPDIEVDLPDELKTEIEISHEEDTQLQAAIEVLCE